MRKGPGRGFAAFGVVVSLIVLLLMTVVAPADQPVVAAVDANSLSMKAGGVQIAEYRYGDVPFKPYIKDLLTPSGLNVLLDAPHDHLHHHGLMFALAVDGVDFWSETAANGRQKHREFAKVMKAREDEAPGALFREGLDWFGPTGQKLLTEQRAVSVLRPVTPPVTILRWGSRLSVPPGKSSVVLTGAHYFGLGMRFIPKMDARGTFRSAGGKPGVIFRGEERLVRADWCAYTTQVDGRDVTVAMFGDPGNPRHPTTWFTMAKPFAYLSATLGLHEEPLKILAGELLELKYAIVLWDRAAETEEIDRLYEELSN
ncbi:MAG: PmoA family protein [Sedimentisphaerales bacterium]|nr:PmoA family protein [Sedimentisphaerales bacterium]